MKAKTNTLSSGYSMRAFRWFRARPASSQAPRRQKGTSEGTEELTDAPISRRIVAMAAVFSRPVGFRTQRSLVQIQPVPVTNLIRAAEPPAPDHSSVNVCVDRAGAPEQGRGNGRVKLPDGRRRDTGRPSSSPDHRGGPSLNPAGLRPRADSGDEVRRPAGSRRCARSLASVLPADRGFGCGGTDAGGWRCSTRHTCAARVGGVVR
jgi:hypothetical protein